MADWALVFMRQATRDLLGAVLLGQAFDDMGFEPAPYLARLAAPGLPLQGLAMGLFGAIAAFAAVAVDLPPDDGSVAAHELGDLRVGVSGFHQRMDLVAFFLGQLSHMHLSWLSLT